MGSGDLRRRDVFPLPLPLGASVSDYSHLSLSRRQRRRISRSIKIQNWYAQGIQTLNELSGAPFSEPGDNCRNAVQVACVEHLQGEYARVPAPPVDASGPRAFSELCRTSTRYDPTPHAVQGERSPYDKDLISWPTVDSEPHDILESLQGTDRSVIENWSSAILKSPSERNLYLNSSDRVKPFLEPSLVRDEQTYAGFVARLDAAGMLCWKRGVASLLGCFFVRKKCGKLRIVLDTRDANNLFRRPPSTRLPTPAAFSHLECEAEDTIYMTGADLSNCFYHLKVPDGLENYFTLPPVRCGAIPGLSERLDLDPDTLVVPALQVLPMGWSWSLHIAQRVHEGRLSAAGADPSLFIQDKKPATSLSHSKIHSAVYVDNHLFFSNLPNPPKNSKIVSVKISRVTGCPRTSISTFAPSVTLLDLVSMELAILLPSAGNACGACAWASGISCRFRLYQLTNCRL